MIESQTRQRLAGMAVLVFGMFLTAAARDVKGLDHKSRVMGAVLGPIVAVLGAGMAVFPLDLPALRAKHGVDGPLTFSQYPWPWKVLILVGFTAGLASLTLLLTR